MRRFRIGAAILAAALFSMSAPLRAQDLIWLAGAGYGPQTRSDQENRMRGADLLFFQYQRSYRQELMLGVGYTDISTNGLGRQNITALSVFPQLNLYAPARGNLRPMFFVRALGPTWLSGRSLGDREQGSRFAFQAQVGAGLLLGAKQDWLLTLSYKHFSNAGLFSPNDSFDLPLTLSIGYRQRD